MRRFTQAGHKVCGCARNSEQLAQLGNQLGSNCRLDPVDVADPVAVAAWAASVIDAFGPPDLLLNNAA
ncbi:MAG: SDR family NAD(P)-dependent oxidoreductase, partial [bacterium]